MKKEPKGKSKVESVKSGGDFAKGGSTHMFGEQAADPAMEGTSSPNASKGPGAKFASGGNGKMFGQQYAGPQQPGVSSHDTKGDGGKFAQGGKGPDNRMFGPQKSNTAKPA